MTEYPIKKVEVSAFEVPTDSLESDGTFEWNSTIMVLVEIQAGNFKGIGYSYTSLSSAELIKNVLIEDLLNKDALNIPSLWLSMIRKVRNIGRPGIASMAIAAVDSALWDLKGKILNLPIAAILGTTHEVMAVYGSGGFTSYSEKQLQDQLTGWVDKGIKLVKIKIGRQPEEDLQRVKSAKEAIGDHADLFVDANGAYTKKQAIEKAHQFQELGVTWFEEPVSSDDLKGLNMVRMKSPGGIDITAGEYGYDLYYFRQMLENDAVDILQADATRCEGITGFLKAGILCEAFQIPLSAHTAPSLHLHPMLSLKNAVHIEYFYDHTRIEQKFFDGAPVPVDGYLKPDLTRPGLGLEFKYKDAKEYQIN